MTLTPIQTWALVGLVWLGLGLFTALLLGRLISTADEERFQVATCPLCNGRVYDDEPTVWWNNGAVAHKGCAVEYERDLHEAENL